MYVSDSHIQPNCVMISYIIPVLLSINAETQNAVPSISGQYQWPVSVASISVS